MTNIPHIIEVALLLLIAYLIGCVIGYFLRAKVFTSGKTASDAPAAAAKSAASSSASPVPADRMAKAAKTKPKTKAPAQAKTAAPAPAAKAALPKVLKAPRDGKKDNLKLIKGVGPKIEEKLNNMGTYHFEQIAAWDRETIAKVDETLSFKGRIDRERWVPQAKALAKK